MLSVSKYHVASIQWLRPYHGQGAHGPEAKAKAVAAAERRKQKKKDNRALKRDDLTELVHLKSKLLKHWGAAEGFVDGRSKAARAANFEAEAARNPGQKETGSTCLEHGVPEADLLPDSPESPSSS